MNLFKINGDNPQVCGHPGDIDLNKGTDGLDAVTLYKSTDGGETWTIAGWFLKNERFGGFGPEILWVEDAKSYLNAALNEIFTVL